MKFDKAEPEGVQMYYKLDIIGDTYPQLDLRDGIFKDGKRPDYKDLTSREHPKKEIDMNDFQIIKRKKITDVLSCNYLGTNRGLFVNEKVKKVLEEYTTEYCRFYPLKLGEKNYFFMHLIDCVKDVDFSKSEFTDLLNNDEIIEVSSYEEFIDIQKGRKKFPQAKKVVLGRDMDIFRLPFGIEIIIGEEVKQKLVESGTTGIEIEPFTRHKITEKA